MVEVFVNSIQQPEEELLGIVLGVTLELQGALGHHILQRGKQKYTAQVDKLLLKNRNDGVDITGSS